MYATTIRSASLSFHACVFLCVFVRLPADSGHYTVTWTIKNGGWPRYISTNLAGLYRLVFGITDVKGLKYNDFKFIPNKAPEEAGQTEAMNGTAAAADDTKPLTRCAHWPALLLHKVLFFCCGS